MGKIRSTPWPKLILRHGKAGLRAAGFRDHDSFKRLEALFVAFFDLYLHADGIAGYKVRNICALGLASNFSMIRFDMVLSFV